MQHAKRNSYNRSFVNVLFNILDLPILYRGWSGHRLAPLMVESLVLNFRIWCRSDLAVQVLMTA